MTGPPRAGDVLPAITLPLTLRRMIVNAGAGWDFFPGHHDPEYAREHGHPTVFANTSLFLALADRTITDWAGPRTRIVRRRLAMERPAYAGDTLTATGVVDTVDDGTSSVEVRIEIRGADGVCARARATIELAPAVEEPEPGR